MSPAIATRKQELADRIMRIEHGKVLDQVEELLLKLEMQARHDESVDAINRGEVVPLEEFHRGNLEWLAKESTK